MGVRYATTLTQALLQVLVYSYSMQWFFSDSNVLIPISMGFRFFFHSHAHLNAPKIVWRSLAEWWHICIFCCSAWMHKMATGIKVNQTRRWKNWLFCGCNNFQELNTRGRGAHLPKFWPWEEERSPHGVGAFSVLRLLQSSRDDWSNV